MDGVLASLGSILALAFISTLDAAPGILDTVASYISFLWWVREQYRGTSYS